MSGAEQLGDVVRVLIVDDHDLFRTGLATMLGAQEGIDVVGQASGGRSGVRLAHELKPDVVLMDLRMPDLGGVVGNAGDRRARAGNESRGAHRGLRGRRHRGRNDRRRLWFSREGHATGGHHRRGSRGGAGRRLAFPARGRSGARPTPSGEHGAR